jgi:hypothetical protein
MLLHQPKRHREEETPDTDNAIRCEQCGIDDAIGYASKQKLHLCQGCIQKKIDLYLVEIEELENVLP